MKYLFNLSLLVMISLFVAGLSACDDGGGDSGEIVIDKVSIVGTWVDGSTTMKLGSDGSYYLTDTSVSGTTQYRKGTYSYNESLCLLTVDVVAVAGQNSAYQQTYIVQNLTTSSLVLLYLDGDVEGYYTRV